MRRRGVGPGCLVILFLVGCADFLIDQIKEGYAPESPRPATGAVWPPLPEEDAPEVRTIGGTATTRVGEDGRTWTFDVVWNLSFYDEGGGAIEGVAGEITLDWVEWASDEGDVYRIVEPFACAPAEGTAAASIAGGRLLTVLDLTGQAAEVDPEGVRFAAVEELLAGQAGAWSGFGLGAYADGSDCVADDVELYAVGGVDFPADPATWSDKLADLVGCEAGARHYLFEAVESAATAVGEPGAILVYAADGDAGSEVGGSSLAAAVPPVFEVRAENGNDVVDEVLVTQTSGGATVLATEEVTPAAFDAVGTMFAGGAGGYRCTARIEVETADEGRTPSWLQSYAYLPPTGTRVQVSVPFILGFSSL